MPHYGAVPSEPARSRDLDALAPQFRARVQQLLDRDATRVVFEALRSAERQSWLYGFGRDYDDGRGLVTHAATITTGWHGFGLAVDIIHATQEWSAPSAWWDALGADAVALGLVWGGAWKMRDLPHVQWGDPMRTTPSPGAARLVARGGLPLLWQAVHAA